MVTHKGTRDSIIKAICALFDSLPHGIAILNEETLEHEHVMTINPNAFTVEFRISHYGTFGLYFGKGCTFEEIPSSIEVGLDICESIRHGRVKEEVWEWRGHITKTKGALQLSAECLADWGSSHWAALLGLGTNRQIQYEPWDRRNFEEQGVIR